MKNRYSWLLSLVLGMGASFGAFAADCSVTVNSIVGASLVLKANCGNGVDDITWQKNGGALAGPLTFPVTNADIFFTTPLLSGVNVYSATSTNGSGATALAATITGAQWLLNVSATVGGSVSGTLGLIDNCTSAGGTCSASYNNGSAVTLTPTADSVNGYTFAGWAGDCTGTGNCVLGMTAPRVVVANFNQGPINGVCSGTSPTINAPPASCSAGTPGSVTTTASAYTWPCTGANGGASPTCSAPRQFNVNASAGVNGTISPSGATARTVTHGATTTFTVTPNNGYTATMGGTCPAGSLVGTTYTTGAITAACTVTATFTNAPVNGVCSGTSPTVNAPPASCSAGTPGSVTTTASAYTWPCTGANGGASPTCSAPRQFNVDASAGANGTISPSGATARTVTHGATTTFTVTPNNGFTATMGGTCPAGSLVGTGYTTGAITGACTVTATFASSTPPPGSCGAGEVFDTLLGDKDWTPFNTFALFPVPATTTTGSLGRAIRFVANNTTYPNGVVLRIVDESVAALAKDVVISACPHNFTPVNNNVKCVKTGAGSSSQLYLRFGAAINSYDCPLTPGATYYINFRKYTTSGDFSGTVSSQFTLEPR